jgi:hypothetical protein
VHERRPEEGHPPRPIASDVLSQLLTYKRVAALVAALLCVVVTLVAANQGVLAIGLNLVFWLCILTFASTQASVSQLRLFLPLTLLFYFTFYFNREVVETWDKILNSDTPRHLLEATTLRAQARHLGFPVITFPYVAVNRLGSTLLKISNLGREFLYLQVALAGTVAATLLRATLLQYERPAARWPRIRAALVAYVFALSFAVWSLSSVIDTFMVSTMLLLMFLLDLRHFVLTKSTISCVTLALITVIALLISLENVYFIGLFGLALAYEYVRGHTRWIVKYGSLYLTIVLLTFVLILQSAAVAAGPSFYRTSGDERFPAASTNLVDNLYRYTRRFVDLQGALEVRRAMGVVFKTWVMAISAQHDASIENYVVPSRKLTTGNLVYFSLILPLVLVGMRGLVRRLPRDVLFMVIVLIGMLIIRYAFMLVYARGQNALFATPSIAGFWLLIGLGLSQYSDIVTGRREKVVAILLTVLGIFLLVNNGYYLLHIA